jgi:protocatechuate 3,4-dioxygenase beta subunit
MLGLLKTILPLLLATSVFAQRQTAVASADTQFHISGTVVSSPTGQVLADTEVSIGRAQTVDTVKSMVTEQNGHFDFDGVSPGKYWLAAQRRGFSRQSFEEHQGYFTAIAVGPHLQSEDLVFRLRPDASISGSITDDQNDPVRDAQVMLVHAAVENGTRTVHSREQSTTNDQGHYRFSHLQPGKYFIAVSARPWYAESQQQYVGVYHRDRPHRTDNGARVAEPANSALDVAYPLTFYAGTTDANSATPVSLKPGDHADADVSLTPVPAIHLRVHAPGPNSDGELRPQVSAMLTERLFGGAPTAVAGQTIQNDHGEFVISGIAPGQFDVTLQSYGKDAKSWTQTINVSGDSEINMTGSTPSAVVSGKIKLDDDTAPQMQAFIEFQSGTLDESFGAPVSASGEFTATQMPVKPGNYEVSVLSIPGAVVGGIAATGARAAGRNIEIDGKEPVELTVRLTRRLGVVNGTALRDGKPLGGVMVVLVPTDAERNKSLFRRDQSDSDGTFALTDVFPGRYTLLAIEKGWDLEWSNPASLLPFIKQGQLIEVLPDAKLQIRVKAQ